VTSGSSGVSGIVLAGGRSVRFGSDKLGATLVDRPLLHLAIEAVASVCDEVVVVVGADRLPNVPRGLAVPLRVVRDEEPDAGPLAALIVGLGEAHGSFVVVAAGDMPTLVPGLLRELVRRACGDGFEAAALRDGEHVRPIPSAFRREPALAQALALRAGGGSSLRALLAGGLRVDEMTEADWRRLDPEGSSLLDVDRPEDLERVRLIEKRSPARSGPP
jgi:molybdopterin-guanine dinucleotide biosynthesis protein A